MENKKFEEVYKAHLEWIDSGGKRGSQLRINNEDLSRCVFVDREFEHIKLKNCNFGNAKLDGTSFPKSEISNCDMSKVKGLSSLAFALCNTHTTSLPEYCDFKNQIQAANEIASKQTHLSRTNFFLALFIFYICFSIDDADIIKGYFTLPNPFFELNKPIHISALAIIGIIVVYMMDFAVLSPITHDTNKAFSRLPIVFPNGDKIYDYINNQLFRWAYERQARTFGMKLYECLPDNSKGDLEFGVSLYFAFDFCIRHICCILLISVVAYVGAEQLFLDVVGENYSTPPIFKEFNGTFINLNPLMLLLLSLAWVTGPALNNQGFSYPLPARIAFSLCTIATLLGIWIASALTFAIAFVATIALAQVKHDRLKNIAGLFIVITVCAAAHLKFSQLDIRNQKISVTVPAAILDKEAILVGPNLSGFNLSKINAENVFLPATNFMNAILRDANLRGANLSNSNFEGAVLDDANLSGADLRGANFTEEQVCKAKNYDQALTSKPIICREIPSVPIGK